MCKVRLPVLVALTGTLLLTGCDKGSTSAVNTAVDGEVVCTTPVPVTVVPGRSNSPFQPAQPAQPIPTGKSGTHYDSFDDNGHRTTAGSYNVLIRGNYSGSGTATVTVNSIQITAMITDAHGTVGTLSATIPVSNDRFNGNGSLTGAPVSIAGRMDPADLSNASSTVLAAPRMVATFSTPDGSFGRVVGVPVANGNGGSDN